MFTGIIEELGVVASLIQSSQVGKLALSSPQIAAVVKIGESVAVNGVCLTVSNQHRNIMEFDVSAETIKKSTLRDLKIGDKVNLERALLISNRVGGHLVTGHVDGVGEIKGRIAQGKGFEFHISLPSDLIRYLVPKGSISIDGISLTVADLRDGLVVLAVIPHSAAATNLGLKKIGDRVNVEVDMLSKYIERHLSKRMGGMVEDPMLRVGYLPMGWTDN